ncbi:MAG: MoaD/ThiS family protein [Lentisphaeria bacterium]|jgi:molybdopterin converting factor small subunit|nr:MoaD/ThiS family protein [Lentisphaeria bacterium]
MAVVFIPYALRKYAAGADQVDMPADTLGELIEKLEDAYPGMRRHLIVDDALKPGLAAVVGQTATRRGLLQKLDDDVEVHFVTAIAGG